MPMKPQHTHPGLREQRVRRALEREGAARAHGTSTRVLPGRCLHQKR